MRVAVLGASAVVGFVGAALARGGHHVVFVLRPGTAAGCPANVQVSSRLFGDFSTAVPAVDEFGTAYRMRGNPNHTSQPDAIYAP